MRPQEPTAVDKAQDKKNWETPKLVALNNNLDDVNTMTGPSADFAVMSES